MNKIIFNLALILFTSSAFASTTFYCPQPKEITCSKGICTKEVSNFKVTIGGYPAESFQATSFCGASYNAAQKGKITCSYIDSSLTHRSLSTGQPVPDTCSAPAHVAIATYATSVTLPLTKPTSTDYWNVFQDPILPTIEGQCAQKNSSNLPLAIATKLCPITPQVKHATN